MIHRFKILINTFLSIFILNLLTANVVEIKVADCEINGDETVSYRIDVRNNEPFEGWQWTINPEPALTGVGSYPNGGIAHEMGHLVTLGQNGVLLGINLNYQAIPANPEFVHLTTISYEFDQNQDPCSMPMELIDVEMGDIYYIWGSNYQFTGHIVNYIDCSDGISQTGFDCISNGGEPTILNADLIWHGFDPVSLGDVNMDGIINVLDIISIVNHILGTVLLDDNQFGNADMNGNGSVDVADIIQIINIILTY